MYRQQLVWTGYGWQYVNVFVPINTGIYNGFYNGYYPWTGVNHFLPGQVVSASYGIGNYSRVVR
jgi:hypothetical protein